MAKRSGHADSAGQPHPGPGCEALHARPAPENGSRPQEGDAGRHRFHGANGIGVGLAGRLDGVKDFKGQYGEQGCCHRDENMRPEACFCGVHLPLDSDHGAKHRSEKQPQADDVRRQIGVHPSYAIADIHECIARIGDAASTTRRPVHGSRRRNRSLTQKHGPAWRLSRC